MNDLPSYASLSPVGIHIIDLAGFSGSPHKAPVSSDPERVSWTTQEMVQSVVQAFPTSASGRSSASLLIYNKSRDVDRICPCCRRWYRAGEPMFGGGFTTFNEFVTRPPVPSSLDSEHDEVVREQDLSGICSRICMAAMTADEDNRLNIEQVTPEQIIGRSPLKDESKGWDVRKTSPEEQESMGGVKLIFYKK